MLDGDPGNVHVWVWKDFTSGLRAYGDAAEAFRFRLAAGEFDGKISLLPAGERPDYGTRCGIPWDKYCSGIAALRSAARHAGAWAEICVLLGGGGELLARLAAGQEPTRNWRAAPNTDGGVVSYGDGWSQAVSQDGSSRTRMPQPNGSG